MEELDLKNEIEKLRNSKAGSSFQLTGMIYSARDAAHMKLKEMLDTKKKIPLSFKDSIIYYMGPTPKKPGNVIGSCGPTSSYRMDDLLEITLRLGVAATIGKGERDTRVFDLIKKYKSPYLVTIGGAGAYLAGRIVSSKAVLFEELHSEAIFELYVKDFPVIVGIDIFGNTILKKISA